VPNATIPTRTVDDAIMAVVGRYEVIGVRQLFYQMVSLGFPKTEGFYKRIEEEFEQMVAKEVVREADKIVDGIRERMMNDPE
jgi:hypothetical protein